MAVACASRFAVLKLEDDDILDKVGSQNLKSNQNVNSSGKNKTCSSKNGGGITETKSKPKKKKKGTNDVAELQNLAFGSGKSKSKGGSQNHGLPRNVSVKQWEEWKKKDTEVYDAIQKETEQNKSSTQAQRKKKKNCQKKEKGIMSLDEFQSLSSSQIDSGNFKPKFTGLDDFSLPEKHPVTNEGDFFDKIEEDAEKIIVREHKQDSYKNMEQAPTTPDSRTLQFQEEMLKKDEEIKSLTEEVNRLKEELKIVKTRNKKLYGILATGEMREKAEILVQIEQLTSVKDELTDELSEFHAALEQERSKVHTLQQELKKFQSNRKEHRDSK